jgi:hypothetical protein
LIQRFARCDSIVAPKLPLADFCNNIGRKPTQLLDTMAANLASGTSWQACHVRSLSGSQLPVAARCCDARRSNPAAVEKLSKRDLHHTWILITTLRIACSSS